MVLDALFLCEELLPSGKSGFWGWDGCITAGCGANCRTQRANELEGPRTLHGWVQVDSTVIGSRHRLYQTRPECNYFLLYLL
jgi:hypothetical protein